MATKTITAAGNAQIDTAIKKFGTGSAMFDGTDDALNATDDADFSPGTGAFTIDFWCYIQDWSTLATGFDMRASDVATVNDLAVGVQWTTDHYGWLYGLGVGGGRTLSSIATVLDTWFHVAIVGNGGADGSRTVKMYQDGVLGATVTANYNLNVNKLKIGNNIAGGGAYGLNGQIDEFRFSKGVQRWTTGFTPPSSAYSTDGDTILLLHCDGADASTTFIDSSVIAAYTLTAAVGSFVLSGITTSFYKSLHMAVSAGSFILTGISTILKVHRYFTYDSRSSGSLAKDNRNSSGGLTYDNKNNGTITLDIREPND